MIDTDDLLTAVRTALTGAAGLSACAGNFFLDAAPDGTPRPYVAFSVIDDTPEARVLLADIEAVLIQVSVYATALSQANALGKTATELFDRKTLTLTGQANLSGLLRLHRVNHAGRDSQGEIYCALSQISLRVQVTY